MMDRRFDFIEKNMREEELMEVSARRIDRGHPVINKTGRQPFYRRALSILLCVMMLFSNASQVFAEQTLTIPFGTSDSGNDITLRLEDGADASAAMTGVILPDETEENDTETQTDAESVSDAEETESEQETSANAETETETEEESVVPEKVPEKREYSYEDDAVSVVAVLEDPAAVPDDAEFIVTPVNQYGDGYNYDAYMEALNETVDGVRYTESNTLLYDIAFMVEERDTDGNLTGQKVEYEPETGSVSITVSFKNNQISEGIGAESAADVEVHHLPLAEEVREAAATTQDATDITAADISVETIRSDVMLDGSTDEVSFATESLSVFAFTVNFEYSANGEIYHFSMPGNGRIKLTELVDTLGILEDANNREKTGFESAGAFVNSVREVSFSDETLLKITRLEGDWELESLKSFETEETLTITSENAKYIIKVTDPATSATQNIASLLTDVSIDAAQNSDGSYTVYAGQAYSIDLSFREDPNGMQFDMIDGFYYDLPSGIIDADILTRPIMIELSGGDHAGESVPLDYIISDNRIIFSWPDQSSGAYEQLRDAIYTHFKIHIEGQFDENASVLEFNDEITKKVDVKTDGKADVSKSGTYNPSTNSIDYTVYVTSTGVCKNVVVTDTISGTALTYNNDAAATSNKGSEIPSPTTSGNGFSFTIPRMEDGETVTVKYSAAVNLDELTTNEDGSLGTVTQTGNKVTVTPENHPGNEDETSGKDFENKISYSTISKSSSVGETGEDGHAVVTWTIKANENANVSMAGHTISDQIDVSSQSIMKYSGDGIRVVRKNADGSIVSSETIPWNNLTSYSNSAWIWTVPNASPDTGKLSYEITYTTDVDVNGQLFDTIVKNTGTSDNGGSSTGWGTVGPVGEPLVARKVFISKDLTSEEKTVTWEINFDVPASGLDSAVIDDLLPYYYRGYTDSYKNGSIIITSGLAFGESYEVNTDETGHMRVIFYKTVDDHKMEGLIGTGSKRKIRVQFKTVLSEEWLAYKYCECNT